MNQTTGFTVKVLGVLILFIVAFFSIELIQHKSTIKVDSQLEECYSNCNEVVIIPLDDTSLVNEIKQHKMAEYKRDAAERKLRATEERYLAKVEAERIAKLKLEEERKKKAEAEKKKAVAVSRGNKSNNNWIVFEATHYSAFCNTGCTGITKEGYNVKNTIYHKGYRVIAVDPKKIPLGSLVEVQTSYGTFKALAGDTGGDVKGNRIDILVESDNVAFKLGREKVQVRILN